MAVLVVFVAILAIVIYLLNKSRKSPNVIENMPFISGLSIGWAYLRCKSYDEIGDITFKAAKGHEIYMITLNTFSQVSICNPEYAKITLMESEDTVQKFENPPESILGRFFANGLIFTNGDVWRTYRGLATPAFNQAIDPDIVGDTVFDLSSFMEKNYSLDRPIDFYEIMQRLTIEVLGKLAFGYRFGCYDSVETPHLIKLYRFIVSILGSPYRHAFPWINKLPVEANRKFYSAVDEFDEFIYDIMRTKRKEFAYQNDDSDNKRVDLLSTMLEVSEQEGIHDNSKELRDQMINFFVAGHDTTLMALCTSFYHLAKHPEIQEKARAEAIKVIGNEFVIPSSEQIKELKYIHAIVKESLRIHPPAPILTFRQLSKQINVGPYVLPKDTLITVNAWQIHHNPKYWENPNQFNPERFLSNEKRHPYSWIPFSGGPRNCIGQTFSIMEQKVVLAMMLLKYDWTLPEDSINKEKLILAPTFILKPVDLKLNFTKRN